MLTVTDDDDATGSVTEPLTVTVTYLADAFARTVADGWGAADQGGAWSRVSGPGGAFSVDGSAGVMDVPIGSGRGQRIGPDLDSTDVTVTVATDIAASGYGIMAAVVGRSITTQNEYRARARISSSGQVFLAITRLDGSYSEQFVAGETAVSGLVVAPGELVSIRLRTEGTSPTALSAKAWAAGDAEPADWTLAATDSTVSLQVPGRVGLHSVLSSSAVTGPVRFRFADFVATR